MAKDAASANRQQAFARQSVLAMRCNVAQVVTGQALRDFAVCAAESSLTQWFLRIGELDRAKLPSRSALKRYRKWVREETMTAIHLNLITQAVTSAGTSAARRWARARASSANSHSRFGRSFAT